MASSALIGPAMRQVAGPPAPVPARTPASRQAFYLPELDVLRFFAFLGVFESHVVFDILTYHYNRTGVNLLAHHAILNRAYLAGNFGVDLFFCLSAYLITELLLRERATTGRIDVRSFYLRRILRIWPLYFFFLGVTWILGQYRQEFAMSNASFVAMILLVGNFALAGWGIPDLTRHLWSICVEEQFYLLWPPLVRRVSRPMLIRVALAILAIGWTARVAFLIMGTVGRQAAFNTFVRLDPMALGIMLAAIPRKSLPDLSSYHRLALVAFGVIVWSVVAYYYYPFPTKTAAILGYPFTALASAAMLIAAIGAGSFGPGWLFRALVYLGKISYGLYVYHQLADWLAVKACVALGYGDGTPAELALYVAAGFCLSVAFASISYRILESPFLRLKRRFTYVQSRPV